MPRTSSCEPFLTGRPPERHQQLRSAARRRLHPDDRDRAARRRRPVLLRPGLAHGLLDAAERGGAAAADLQRRPAGLRGQSVQRSDADLRPGRGDAVHRVDGGQTACAAARTNFAVEGNEIPYSDQASIGVQRQLGRTMAVEADYVYTGNRAMLVHAQRQPVLQPGDRLQLSVHRHRASGRIRSGVTCRCGGRSASPTTTACRWPSPSA